MNDQRWRVFTERLSFLSLEQIQRIKDNIDIICFDTFNYDKDKKTFCPLAVAFNLHNTIIDPTDEKVQKEIGKYFQPVNVLKGVKGKFYTDNRKEDLMTICDNIIKEKMNEYISDELQKKWINYEFQGKPFSLKSGKYIRAYSKCFKCVHFYDFEKDFMWFSEDDIMTK